MDRKLCRTCGRPVLTVHLEDDDDVILLDANPSATGEIEITSERTGCCGGWPIAKVNPEKQLFNTDSRHARHRCSPFD